VPNQKPNRERRGARHGARPEPLLIAAAGLTGLLLVGCSSNSNSAGSDSAAAATGSSTVPSSASSATATSSTGDAPTATAEAKLLTPGGEQVGIVEFAVDGSVVTVTASVDKLPPGFKGFHIHSIGKCEGNSPDPKDPSRTGDFLSAGGHLGADSAAHPGHQGDLSSLEVRADGSAQLVTTSDAFDMDAVLDADGSAVMVHAGPDNFGNIPTRYAPGGPDATTQATGDSGGRAACGVVQAIKN
jgi:Cu-Zn family superoxide dismutase